MIGRDTGTRSASLMYSDSVYFAKPVKAVAHVSTSGAVWVMMGDGCVMLKRIRLPPLGSLVLAVNP